MVKYVFWVDNGKIERSIKKKTKKEAEKSYKYYKNKGFGVSKIRRIF